MYSNYSFMHIGQSLFAEDSPRKAPAVAVRPGFLGQKLFHIIWSTVPQRMSTTLPVVKRTLPSISKQKSIHYVIPLSIFVLV